MGGITECYVGLHRRGNSVYGCGYGALLKRLIGLAHRLFLLYELMLSVPNISRAVE